MEPLRYLGKLFQPLSTAFVIALITMMTVIRLRQIPTYRKLMAFPHAFESIPVITYLYNFVVLCVRERLTGIDFGVLFWQQVLKRMDQYRKHGCFAMYLGAQPSLIVFRADHVEKVLTSNTNISKGPVYDYVHPWLGLGLLTSTGNKWRTRRKLLTPAFHFRILDEFAVIMNRQAKIFTEKVGSKKPTEDIVPYVTAVTLDIICETIMGVTMNSQTTGSGKKYLRSIKSLEARLLGRILKPTQWVNWIYNLTENSRQTCRDLKELHRFTINVINERKKELEANPAELEKMAANEDGIFKSRKPFLDMLLVEHIKRKTMSVADIREEVDTFMFEGHDTTSMGLIWAIYLIGLHPEVQSKLHKDIDDIFRGDTESEVTEKHIKQLRYLDMVLKESQRIYPSVPRISRTVTKEFSLDDKPVPVGTEVACNILVLHRDPNVFPDPLRFDPDRFLPENCSSRSPFAFVPFSAGPRNCIGQRFAIQEEKILLVWLLRKYSVKSLDPPNKVNFVIEVVLLPKGPIRVQFIPRT